MHEEKRALRVKMRALRDALPEAEVMRRSRLIQDRVAAMPCFQRAREVLLYAACGNEVQTSALMEALWRRGARVLLPRCHPEEKGRLDLGCVSCRSDLVAGRWGILEPAATACRGVEEFAPEVAVIPGVAFDRDGARLGFGAGYYDRLLGQPGLAETRLLGLAYDFQLVPEVPVDPWDRPVHRIVTEQDCIEVLP